jgi:hypothetical protein
MRASHLVLAVAVLLEYPSTVVLEFVLVYCSTRVPFTVHSTVLQYTYSFKCEKSVLEYNNTVP